MNNNNFDRTYFITIVLLFCYTSLFAQRPSPEYYQIVNHKNDLYSYKISCVEELLKTHLKKNNSKQYGLDLTAFSFWLYKNKHLNKAISISEKAVEFYKIYTPYDKKFHLINLNLLGTCYTKAKDYLKSNDVYFEIIKIKGKEGNVGEEYQKIANNYNIEGNFHTATTYFQKAIEEFKIEKKYRGLFYATIGLSQNYQKILDDISTKKGIENLKNLDSLKNKIDYGIYDQYLIQETLGNLYNYENLFDPDVCLPYYYEALSLAKKLQNNRLISVVYNNIGHVYREIDNKTALDHFKESLKYRHEDYTHIARVYYDIGLTYLDQKKYNKAFISLTTSLDTLKIKEKGSKTLEKTVVNLRDKNLAVSLFKLIGTVLIQKYENTEKSKNHLNEALIHLKKADELIDLMKLESTHKESKLFWRKKASDLYINLVKIYFLLDDPKSAYYYLEKNKALLLLEDLTEERSKVFFNIPDSILKKGQELKRKIAKAQNDLISFKKKDNKSIHLFDIKEEYELFMNSLRHKYPTYYKSKNDTNILSFDEVIIQAKTKNTTFIHYILNDKSGYGLVISENEQQLFEIQNIQLFQKYISEFNVLVSKPFSSNADQKEFQKISEELSKNLLPDNLFKHKENKLIIIPDNNLLNLPFEVLINKEGKYLIEDHDISYAYSISFLEQNKQLERSYNKEFLGFAPIHFKNNLTTLTKSNKEINTVAKKFDSDILLKEEASSQNLINSLSNYKIIHLSTHANANDSITPWIATNTEKITLNDIYSSKNNAELVTLSACNTSVGKLQKGEGVMSLARGFFNTGANSLVSTLWKADDQSTQEIITDFYTYLKKGKSKSEALRQAKLIYLKNHSLSEASPYYWSSLVLIGNPEPMYSSRNTWYLLIGILISSLIIFLIFKRFSKK